MEVEMKSLKTLPGEHGDRKAILWRSRFSKETVDRAIRFLIFLIRPEKGLPVWAEGGPENRKTLIVPVENRVGRVEKIVDSRAAFRVQRGAEFRMPIHNEGEGVEQYGVKASTIGDLGDIQLCGHAIGTGDLEKIVVEVLFPGPMFQVDQR